MLATEMCIMHYMRARRTGNPTVKGKPGPKLTDEVASLRKAIAELVDEVASLRDEIAAPRHENARLVTEQDVLKQATAQARRTAPLDGLIAAPAATRKP
jgi:hypothetical protein